MFTTNSTTTTASAFDLLLQQLQRAQLPRHHPHHDRQARTFRALLAAALVHHTPCSRTHLGRLLNILPRMIGRALLVNGWNDPRQLQLLAAGRLSLTHVAGTAIRRNVTTAVAGDTDHHHGHASIAPQAADPAAGSHPIEIWSAGQAG